MSTTYIIYEFVYSFGVTISSISNFIWDTFLKSCRLNAQLLHKPFKLLYTVIIIIPF